MMELVQKSAAFKKALDSNEKSLLLSALELGEDTYSELFNGLRSQPSYQCVHLRMALFLRYFFENSDGRRYAGWFPNYEVSGRPRELADAWQSVYQEPLRGADEYCRTKILTKCWLLKGSENRGDYSAVWECLRDAVYQYQDTGDANAIFVSSNGQSRRKFIDILFSQDTNDTIERTEYRKLAQLLTDEDLLSGAPNPWPILVDVCRRHIKPGARVDWYLKWEDNGRTAKFIVGFDNFPNKVGWDRRYKIGDSWKSIPDLVHVCASARIPWDRPSIVAYQGHEWNTFSNGAQTCFETILENDKQGGVLRDDEITEAKVMESAAQTAASASTPIIPFGVFVRHRSGANDLRRFWWCREEKPQLLRNQNEFLVCSTDREVIERLQTTQDNPNVDVSRSKIDSFLVCNGNEPKTAIYFQKFAINRRPNDFDATVCLEAARGARLPVCIRGNRPFIRISSSCSQIQTSNPSFIVHKAGESLSLTLQYARENEQYHWTCEGGVPESQSGRQYELKLTSQIDAFVPFSIACKNQNGKTVASISGCILPPAVYGGLIADNPNQCVGGGWNARDITGNEIEDRIAGFRQYEVISPKGDCKTFRKAISGTFAWWFEEGNCSYSDMNPQPPLLSSSDSLRSFSVEELGKWSICFPPGISCPEDWVDAGEDWREYRRFSLNNLIDTEAFTFDPNQTEDVFRHPLFGIPLFQYVRQPAKRRLCLDVNGRLGLFVPETDSQTYDIVAYADDDADLLSEGEVLASSSQNAPFTDIADVWDEFIRKHEGHEVFLIVFPLGCPHRLDFTSVAEELKRETDLGWIWPEEWRQANEGAGQQARYDDPRILARARLLRAKYEATAGTFPLRNANFFRNEQEQTCEDIRQVWQQEVLDRMPDFATRIDAWEDLSRQWRECGFHPLLEGICTAIWQKAKENFSAYQPLPQFDWIRFQKADWKRFVEEVVVAPPHFVNLTRDALRDAARGVAAANGRLVLTDNRVEEFNHQLRVIRNNFEKLRNSMLVLPKESPWRQKHAQQVQQVLNNNPDNFPARCLNAAGINNNVANAEMTFSTKIPSDWTPRLVLDNSRIQGNDLMKEVFRTMLEKLSNERHVNGMPDDTPTDREWLFCLAALSTLQENDGGNSPIVKDEQIHTFFAYVLDSFNTKEHRVQLSFFLKSRALCNEVSRMLQD